MDPAYALPNAMTRTAGMTAVAEYAELARKMNIVPMEYASAFRIVLKRNVAMMAVAKAAAGVRKIRDAQVEILADAILCVRIEIAGMTAVEEELAETAVRT